MSSLSPPLGVFSDSSSVPAYYSCKGSKSVNVQSFAPCWLSRSSRLSSQRPTQTLSCKVSAWQLLHQSPVLSHVVPLPAQFPTADTASCKVSVNSFISLLCPVVPVGSVPTQRTQQAAKSATVNSFISLLCPVLPPLPAQFPTQRTQ